MAEKQQEVTDLAARLDATVAYLTYVYLEAREEQEKLIACGLSQKQIESLGPLTPPSFDPLAMLRRVQALGG